MKEEVTFGNLSTLSRKVVAAKLMRIKLDGFVLKNGRKTSKASTMKQSECKELLRTEDSRTLKALLHKSYLGLQFDPSRDLGTAQGSQGAYMGPIFFLTLVTVTAP